MPPIRTVPPAKAVKTERTHEENQERAYIAASRRSDRSLEARVESARRASEIHKRRTGRSLRVTEQDVVNEEMYEEEDDDLPHPYRRLAAGLQTGSPDFNRRLTAYLTNHVAMRSALDQAITSSYAQTYPNAPRYVHNQSMYQSPFTMPQAQQMFYSPTPFDPTPPAPYPMPHATSFMQHPPASPVNVPQRSATNPLHRISTTAPLEPCHSRSVSMPVGPLTPSPSTPTSTPNIHTPQSRPMSTPQQVSASLPSNYNQQMMIQQQHQFMRSTASMQSTLGMQPAQGMQSASSMQPAPNMQSAPTIQQPSSMQQAPSMQTAPNMQSTSGPTPPFEDYTIPYTMSLPPETQMLLGNALDPNDPLTSAMMAGSETLPSYYDYSSYLPDTKPQATPSYDGLTTTLAPGTLDLDVYATSTLNQEHTQIPDYPYGVPTKTPSLTRNASTTVATNDGGTPGADKEWAAFIENDWE
ncbi:MAG: hypothetical protein M1840_007548 [Geoglossum simile]|nr:MAG: hypothetical protein M1840_007548 [Geoglossum simile]